MVSIVGSVAGGSRRAGSDEFANIHAHMLMEGTAKHGKREIQEALDLIGAGLSFSHSSDRLHFAAYARPKNVPKLLALIAEILTDATFPARELSVLKKREAANLTFAAQDTRTQASIALSRLLYPAGHPNHAETTDESLRALGHITSKKLSAYHARTLDQSSLILSVAGDITPEHTFAFAQKYFKRLPVQPTALPLTAPSAPDTAEKVAIPIENKESIDYLIGIATGIAQDHPDYPALAISMNILGHQGFVSRLMKTVREKEGLTYGVYGNMSGFSRRYDGALSVWANFAPQMFKRGRASIMREIKKIVTKGVTESELRTHTSMFLARRKTALSTSSAYASLAHGLAADDLPLSYPDALQKKIEKLTVGQVNAALKKYIVPKLMSEASAGAVQGL